MRTIIGIKGMKIDGGCHCGLITYEAEVDPEKVAVCHCTDCQTLSGSAFRSVVPALEGTFKLLSGQPKIYIKKAESDTKRTQVFCPECGSPLYSGAADPGPDLISIRVGSARQRADLIPKAQYWCRSAQEWGMDLGTLKRVETR